MKDRILKAKQLKVLLQKRTVLKKQFTDLNLGLGSEQEYASMHVSDKDLLYICKLFNLVPTRNNSRYGDGDKHVEYEVCVEDIIIFALFEKGVSSYVREFKCWFAEDWSKEYKLLYFDTNDKQKAFEILREKTINKSYIPRNLPIYWMKNYTELEKYFAKKSKKGINYNQILSNYHLYKEKWKEDEGEDRERPFEDYYRPLTFKEYCKKTI